jgi:glycosyltransferase involved in cell wall biosynthesis
VFAEFGLSSFCLILSVTLSDGAMTRLLEGVCVPCDPGRNEPGEADNMNNSRAVVPHHYKALRSVLARPHVVVISSFPPRECGIATYTRDLISRMVWPASLRTRLMHANASPCVIAMEEEPGKYRYDSRVISTIQRDDPDSYRAAAQMINHSALAVVSIQHEYGLYGGEYGEYLLDFLRIVRKPVIITMHTVLDNPDPAMRRITEEMAKLADGIVVLAERARGILATYYPEIDLRKVHFIPHGAPSVPLIANDAAKADIGFAGRTVAATFGLLSPDKGIEYAIGALPELVKRHPDLVYLVLGQTHPGHKRYAGEAYREMLEAKVRELGLEDHVIFDNRYLSMDDLLRYLQACDLYVIPYLNPRQIASGTLTYAVACGKPVISTGFVHAQEMLSDERGMVVNFRDSADLARAMGELLDHPAERAAMGRRAYNYGRRLHWPAVARAYCRLFSHAEAEARIRNLAVSRRAREALLRRQAVAGAAALVKAATDAIMPAAPKPAQVSAPALNVPGSDLDIASMV